MQKSRERCSLQIPIFPVLLCLISAILPERFLDKEQSVFLKLSLVPELDTSDLIAFFSACKENNAERNLLACLNGLVHEKNSGLYSFRL